MDAEWKELPVPADAAADGGPANGEGARRPARDSLFLMAQVSVAGGEPREVRVRNLSERGLMAEMPRTTEPGTPVTLELRGIGVVDGRIAWWAEGRAGIALDRAIDPALARRRIAVRPTPVPLPVPARRR